MLQYVHVMSHVVHLVSEVWGHSEGKKANDEIRGKTKLRLHSYCLHVFLVAYGPNNLYQNKAACDIAWETKARAKILQRTPAPLKLIAVSALMVISEADSEECINFFMNSHPLSSWCWQLDSESCQLSEKTARKQHYKSSGSNLQTGQQWHETHNKLKLGAAADSGDKQK